MALVLDLHGLTADPGSQEDLSAMARMGLDNGFVVAQSLGRGQLPSWSAGDNTSGAEDVAFLQAVVAAVGVRVSIDRDRVYASGFSNGGGMANRLACDAADTFAAVASVSGSYIEHTDCRPARRVAVLAFHGTNDVIVPYEGCAILPDVNVWAEAWAARNGCAPVAVETPVAADVTLRVWPECQADGDVALYIIEDGGHGWPGTTSAGRLIRSTNSIVATDLIWDFFSRHARAAS